MVVGQAASVAGRLDDVGDASREIDRVSDVVADSSKATDPNLAPRIDNGAGSSNYNRTSFDGNRVYQRDDLIDPSRVVPDGRTNLDLMEAGRAPFGPDGKPVNLHHMTQRPNGAIAEVTQTMHTQNWASLRINSPSIPSGINRRVFN